MAPPAADDRRANLRSRILSAAVLAPLVIEAVLLGGLWFHLLVVAAAAIMAWEWSRLCGGGRFGPAGWLLIGGVVAAVAAAGLTPSPQAAAVICGAALLLAAGGAFVFGGASPAWIAAGSIYIAVPCIAFIWLRDRPAAGLDLVIWLLLVTWAADIGGFAVGRSVGGPRLAPRISPGKTWSGLAGGLVAAVAVGSLYAAARDWHSVATAAQASLLLGLVAAGGDLLESATKRRFHVKDASALIPGHGGLLDRVDSLLLAAIMTALLVSAGWAPL